MGNGVHLRTACEVVRFPSNKIPAALHQYLELDETRPEGLDALVRQAEKDADMTNSLCNDATSHDGRLIKSLFESMPCINH